MIHIARIQQSVMRFEQRFITRVFTAREYELARQRGTYRRLAMFFAAKEAVAKALGTGFSGFAMKDIEVTFLQSGKPEIVLHGAARKKADDLAVGRIHLSLTDDDGKALAFAITESI